MSVVLRPGRFLGNHYLAFTVPQRTFIITMDRVWNGVRAARENKKVTVRSKQLKEMEEMAEAAAERTIEPGLVPISRKNGISATASSSLLSQRESMSTPETTSTSELVIYSSELWIR